MWSQETTESFHTYYNYIQKNISAQSMTNRHQDAIYQLQK